MVVFRFKGLMVFLIVLNIGVSIISSGAITFYSWVQFSSPDIPNQAMNTSILTNVCGTSSVISNSSMYFIQYIHITSVMLSKAFQ